jgi:hypothetical protein
LFFNIINRGPSFCHVSRRANLFQVILFDRGINQVCNGAAATFITKDKVIKDEEINITIFLIVLFSLYKNLIIKILDAAI